MMGNAGTTAMLLSLALAVGNKLVGTVRGHWLRCQADRKKLKAQSRRIQRLERELREAKAAAQVVRVGGGGVDAAGGAGKSQATPPPPQLLDSLWIGALAFARPSACGDEGTSGPTRKRLNSTDHRRGPCVLQPGWRTR